MASWIDLPGYAAATIFFLKYPIMKRRGGWGLVLGSVISLSIAGTLCNQLLLMLESRDPTECDVFEKKRRRLRAALPN
ncbi:hypothetical protein N9L31_00125 [bacterium]|nr:hypothetical protein [bacterium]